MEIDCMPAVERKQAKLRWYQYGLRTLLVVVTIFGIACSWFATRLLRAKRQEEAVEAIQRVGGVVYYNYQLDASNTLNPEIEPPGPVWLRKLLGVDFFWNVTEVHFSFTELTDKDFEHLKGLTQLQILTFNETEVTDAGLECIKNLNGLQRLALDKTTIRNVVLAHLEGMKQVQWLSLWRTNITDNGLEHLKGLKNLQYLNLAYNQITDAGLKHLKGLSQLKTLVLLSSQVTDAGLECIKGMKQLQMLDLRETPVTDAGIKDLQEALPNTKIIR